MAHKTRRPRDGTNGGGSPVFGPNKKETWRDKKFGVYLDPLYYEEILPVYKFGGKTDEEVLDARLNEKIKTKGKKFRLALELGCGTGRATKILRRYCENIVAVDLSEQMLGIAKNRLASDDNIRFFQGEMLDFVARNKGLVKDADLVFSFWALNYSLIPEFTYTDREKKTFRLKDQNTALENCFKKLRILFDAVSGADFLFFHYDPESEEQKISHRCCWEKVVPFPFGEKSPSLFAIKKFLETQADIDSCICRLNGVVEMGDRRHALETYMNFHLHTFFNYHPLTSDITGSIKRELKKYDPENVVIGAGTIMITAKNIGVTGQTHDRNE